MISPNSPSLKIHIIRDFQDIESIRDSWLRLQDHPNIDIDQYRALAGILHPYVIAVEKDGKIVSLVVGRMAKYSLPIKIGYRTFFRIPFKSIVISHGGFLGEFSGEIVDGIIDELERALREKEAELIFINALNTSTAFHQGLEKKGRHPLKRILVTEKQVHWRIVLPDTYQNYIDNLEYKVRKNLRRAERKLSNCNLEKVGVEKFTDVNDLDRFILNAQKVSRKTYQNSLGVGFRDTPEIREVLSIHARRGRFRGYLLWAGGKAIAFDMGIMYGNIFFWNYGGYDPEYRQFEPGTNLFLRIMQDLFLEKEIDEIDFGLGDAEYKQRFCNRSWDEETIFIFGPSIKGIALWVLMNIFSRAERNLEGILKKIEIYPKIKRFWRKRAAAKAKHAEEAA